MVDRGERNKIDYTLIKYTKNNDELIKIGKTLGEIAVIIENHYKVSQDIEGAIYQDNVYIVQSRQQM